MSAEAFIAETSISGSAIGAHDSGAIANLFAKEKAELTTALATKDDEVDALKLKIYRLENEITSLKTEAKQSKRERKTSTTKSISDCSDHGGETLIDAVYGTRENTITSITDSNKHTSHVKKKTVKKVKKGKKHSVTTNGLKSSSLAKSDVTSEVNSCVPAKCPKCDNALQTLKDMGEKFPQIKLKTYVSCREKFNIADKNGDGTVDTDELSTILESAGLFFTKSQIHDILSKVDTDDNVALDFPEVVQVVSSLEENPNRRADLPKSLKDNQSKVCAVM